MSSDGSQSYPQNTHSHSVNMVVSCQNNYYYLTKLCSAPTRYVSMCTLTCLIILVLQHDEYVVYSPDQVKLKYLVQLITDGDSLKEFSPAIITSPEPCLPPSDQGEHQGLACKIT